MQVDCEFTRENDGYDTDDRRSVAPHQILTKELSQKSKAQPSQLGEELSLVLYKPRRTSMVERIRDSEECTPDSQNSTGQSKDDNLCRCFRYRLGSCLNIHQDVGILDRRRVRNVDKRPTVQDDLVCLTAPCRKVPRVGYSDFERQ
ncbi:hypothetical protein G6F56_010212 [Rhizopus delemar]|nr:hypothetical protein G6F56_010212 [Rhizopus delemar]